MSQPIDIVAIIPARAGSKRLPRKNLLPLDGKPIIQWTIDAALDSNVIDLIVVTSDDDEILDIANNNNLETIRRPDYLATDTASTFDVIVHALEIIESKGFLARRVMLLQPTSPLRTSTDIRNAVDTMKSNAANSVISVCEVEHSPLWCNVLGDDKRMDNFISDNLMNIRSQDLPKYYRLNGAIYLAYKNIFLEKGSFFTMGSVAYIMDTSKSVDIDNRIDYDICKIHLTQVHNKL